MKKKNKPDEALIAAQITTEDHIVTRDGLPCTIVNVSGLHRGGLLIPGAPVVLFSKPRDARRAIERTVRVRDSLRTSLVSEFLRSQFPSFLEGEKFEPVPAGRQV